MSWFVLRMGCEVVGLLDSGRFTMYGHEDIDIERRISDNGKYCIEDMLHPLL